MTLETTIHSWAPKRRPLSDGCEDVMPQG